MTSILALHGTVSETYGEVGRAVGDSDQGTVVVVQWVLLVPWYTVCHAGMSTMRETGDEDSHERAWQ